MIKPIKILILSESASFPWGMAAANRVRNLAKGIISSQCNVEYIGLQGASAFMPSEDKKKSGIFDGIKYFYPGGFPVRSSNWLMRRLDDILGICLSVMYILWNKFKGKLDLVIIYSRNYLVVSFWTRFLHLIHIPVVLEVCEWPLAIKASGKSGVRHASKYCYKAVPKVDAVLPISTYIDNEIRKIAESMNKNMPSCLIPILIDITPDRLPPKPKSGKPYLLYSGDISYKNISKLVVDTVQELNYRGFNLFFKFTGEGPKEYFDHLKQYAAEKGVLHQFEFTGFVEEYELYRLMRGALALLAPLPHDLQTEARFSTKLGYYLASGTPIVTNSVGDVGLYLQDGINAFVAKKFNNHEIANKIEQIINNPINADEVGRNGQKLAMEKFHYSSACKGLNGFLQQTISNYYISF